ncbi:MAG: YicC family protein [Bacteroidales bacterium]|nr:YicC family protein [Bacteroidales bacterium]
MLKSMTGFGKAECKLETKNVSIEIKSLNSKQLDVFTKIPACYKEKDLNFRNEISKTLIRGKVELFIYEEVKENENRVSINSDIINDYYRQLEEITKELDIDKSDDFLQIIMRLPDTIKVEKTKIEEDEWQTIFDTFKTAINDLNEFRIQEGEVLEKDISKRIYSINNLISEIEVFESDRMEKIKLRIKNNLNDLLENEKIDQNRFEQELIYYMEKIDITEEKVRLENHCNYFLETLNEDKSIGKKLGFIAQEIGREINTIGSKANNADIQKLVVQMKDELEKIKEQLMNIL